MAEIRDRFGLLIVTEAVDYESLDLVDQYADVIQIGARTTVYLNGKLVVDHALLENVWNRKLPLFKKGPIQLQTHGGEIRWRNIFVREIPAAEANEILGKHAKDGFKPVSARR